jgi:hypothetical protein
MIAGFDLHTGDAMTLEQDNKATITFHVKGHGTFKRTKHIDVRYFWTHGLVEAGLLVVKYIPTLDMVADLLSKPIVGSKFVYLLGKLIGYYGGNRSGNPGKGVKE